METREGELKIKTKILGLRTGVSDHIVSGMQRPFGRHQSLTMHSTKRIVAGMGTLTALPVGSRKALRWPTFCHGFYMLRIEFDSRLYVKGVCAEA